RRPQRTGGSGAVELVRVRRPQRDARPRPRGHRPLRSAAIVTVVPSLVEPQVGPPTPIAADRETAAEARLTELDGRTVALFRVDGSWPGTDGSAEADVVLRALQLGASVGCPVVGLAHSVAGAPNAEGVAGLVAWGRVAREAARLSGVVPLL